MCYNFQWKKMWFILCTFWIQSYGYKVSKYLTDIHWTSFFCKLFVSAHNSCNSLCNSSTFHQGNSSNLFLDIISTEFAYFVDFSINLIKSKNWFETPAYFEMRTPAFRVLLETAVFSLWKVCVIWLQQHDWGCENDGCCNNVLSMLMYCLYPVCGVHCPRETYNLNSLPAHQLWGRAGRRHRHIGDSLSDE